MQKMVVERLVAARRDETCALSLLHLHSRSPLSFSHTHKHWRRGRRTRSAALTASRPPGACSSRSTTALPASPPGAPRTPSARPSPTAWRASPLGCSPKRPSLPDAPEPVGKQVFPSLHHALTPSSLPPFARDLLWGWAPPTPFAAFQAPLLLGCTWQEIGPRARPAPRIWGSGS